jgi:hypothetical protein
MDYSRLALGALMRGWRVVLLIFELFLFALILILPQVDLPDFTFPGGTAPILAKSRLCSPPTFSIVPAPVQARSLLRIEQTTSREIRTTAHLNPLSPVTLTCILRC